MERSFDARLQLILPRLKPTQIIPPAECPYEGCQGRHLCLYQQVTKPLKDTVYRAVKAYRYRCPTCRRTFRVYPEGVSNAHTSLRVKGLAVMLYFLGLSYEATSLTLEALGAYMCKSSVYEAVQETAQRVPGLKRREVFEGVRTGAARSDVTSVKCKGQWLSLCLAATDIDRTILTMDLLPGEEAQTLRDWMEPVIEAVGMQLLVGRLSPVDVEEGGAKA